MDTDLSAIRDLFYANHAVHGRLLSGNDAAVDGATVDAAGRVGFAFALSAGRSVDGVNAVIFADGFGGAIRFADSARGALIGVDGQCHETHSRWIRSSDASLKK
jgi:hypothetical protein